VLVCVRAERLGMRREPKGAEVRALQIEQRIEEREGRDV
jgi:hypothetical protein